jgi:xylulose-5-phosphate/fructose-6-phosphate phosphoketolase
MDVIDRVPQTGSKGLHLKRLLQDKLIEHKLYIDRYGQDLTEIRQWQWDNPNPLSFGDRSPLPPA